MSSLFKIFNKPLSKAMTDNEEIKFCNKVDLISLHIWSMYCSIAKNVLSRDMELVGTKILAITKKINIFL